MTAKHLVGIASGIALLSLACVGAMTILQEVVYEPIVKK